ncbi:hypothetical protein AMAG_15120 [Allomyces macrogynus ATCC 38327]|uniref:VTT domain-containing protein n=1 Tax=Allomyces macrogynus (strain ATCC 38327) TaxID=578462 RepID=A0A0L0T5X0_ALLM3|nr:hypothetical protein AMAG_15120 [Allomyces macrogynus ATCC 38327]|eukprot:KNE70147.1 hypothetical protein AMAG_15120 [Allomyces macrogynus ATCC 38327]
MLSLPDDPSFVLRRLLSTRAGPARPASSDTSYPASLARPSLQPFDPALSRAATTFVWVPCRLWINFKQFRTTTSAILSLPPAIDASQLDRLDFHFPLARPLPTPPTSLPACARLRPITMSHPSCSSLVRITIDDAHDRAPSWFARIWQSCTRREPAYAAVPSRPASAASDSNVDLEAGAAVEPDRAVARRADVHPAWIISAVVVVFGVFLAIVVATAPPLTESQRDVLHMPSSVDELAAIATAVLDVSTTHQGTVVAAFCLLYTFLQTLSVPGSLMMTILAGALFPLPIAILLVCTCTSLGASACYFLSRTFGTSILHRLIGARLASWQSDIDTHRTSLFNYIVFLRATPLLPNWFINLASPHLSVPLPTFAIATFVGVIPPSFVYARAGTSLHELNGGESVWMNPMNVAAVAVFAVMSVVPIWVRRRQRIAVERDAAAAGEWSDEEELLVEQDHASKPGSRVTTPVVVRVVTGATSSVVPAAARGGASRATSPAMVQVGLASPMSPVR